VLATREGIASLKEFAEILEDTAVVRSKPRALCAALSFGQFELMYAPSLYRLLLVGFLGLN
jgi:hypothetical protein